MLRTKKRIWTLKDQLPQKDFTFENTCHVLARHYEINIVIHKIKHGIDYPCWIGTGSGKTFKVNQARVDILWERDKDGIGHCDVISPRNTNYKKRYGWHCCFCLKTGFSKSHIHRCSKNYIKTWNFDFKQLCYVIKACYVLRREHK